MSTRGAMTVAFTLILAGPAIADCAQELRALEQNVVAAGTGANTSETGMPGTKHQKEVLDKQKSSEHETTTGSTAPAVSPTSPHQEQVTKRGTQTAEQANQMIAEARKLSAAGNEQECMKKAAELKDALGMK